MTEKSRKTVIKQVVTYIERHLDEPMDLKRVARAAGYSAFHLNRMFAAETGCTIPAFLSIFAGQLLLGGGLEETGWRGYLLPCFARKWHILLSATVTSLIWVFWHLPYFIIPESLHTGQNFLSYTLIGIVTGFILTAIYLLTKSVLLCMLFHSWQNTLVMTLPAATANSWFMLTFLILGAVSALLCLNLHRPDHKSH